MLLFALVHQLLFDKYGVSYMHDSLSILFVMLCCTVYSLILFLFLFVVLSLGDE